MYHQKHSNMIDRHLPYAIAASGLSVSMRDPVYPVLKDEQGLA